MNQLERINRNVWGDLFREFASPEYIMRPFLESLSDQSFKVDVKDCKDHYELQAELPGVNKKDIKIEVEDDRVTISAESKKVTEEKSDEKVIRSERYYGWSSRTVQLEHNVKSEGSVAKFDNGVLTLTLPKLNNHHGKFITVQ
ncbi:MAG: Hsp20/alpha crystallin family protein [Burkholderiaceae bacterium]|nr:Hsp20/alpha crystallin family protein [Burkholderiaceae bacterium]